MENDMNLKSVIIVSLMAAGLTVTAMAQSEVPSSAAYAFMTADHNMRSSKMIGMPVYNERNEKIGTIDDILLPAAGGEVTAVISVGGYLGVGEKMVKVPLNHVHFAANKPAVMTADKPALMAMASYSYTTLANPG
jgi:sporulation protein YlmC with PRC-barrel domain